MTLLVRRRKPFFYFMPGYPGASRAFAIRKLLIAAACDTEPIVLYGGLTVSIESRRDKRLSLTLTL